MPRRIAVAAFLADSLRIFFVILVTGCEAANGQSSTTVAAPLDIAELGDQALICQDFDEYVNGKWRTATQIPPDRDRIDTGELVRGRVRATLQLALVEGGRDPARLDTPGKRLASVFFLSGMDEQSIERHRLQALEDMLRRIDRVTTRSELAGVMAALARLRVAAPIRVEIDTDAKNRKRQILQLDEGGLGLPDRDDYFQTDERSAAQRNAYVDYQVRLATLSNVKKPSAAAKASYELQQRLAAKTMSRVERQDPQVRYQLNTIASLQQHAPGIDWQKFFRTLGVSDPGQFNVVAPRFIAEAARAASELPLAQWRDYLRERLLDEFAPALPKAFVDANFAFRGRFLRGIERPPDRMEQVVELMAMPLFDTPVAEALGEVYVSRTFSAEAKARALEMVEDVRAALRARIQRLEWMSAPTKEAAIHKLDAMTVQIGFPDRWRTYEGLRVDRSDFAGNWLRARAWGFEEQLAELGKPVNLQRWDIGAYLVNAVSYEQYNAIRFPAAILQPPLFQPEADPALNYGAIGTVIGHEITHLFDESGRQFDAEGNLRDWWTEADAASYIERTQRIAEQYATYRPLPDQGINGRLTLGENVSDIGGLQVAYDGLQRALERRRRDAVDGLTQEQRFFIAFARVWRAKYRDNALAVHLRTNPHSPGRFRVIGSIAQAEPFSKAFNCPEGSPVVLPPDLRVTIW